MPVSYGRFLYRRLGGIMSDSVSRWDVLLVAERAISLRNLRGFVPAHLPLQRTFLPGRGVSLVTSAQKVSTRDRVDTRATPRGTLQPQALVGWIESH